MLEEINLGGNKGYGIRERFGKIFEKFRELEIREKIILGMKNKLEGVRI